MAKKRKSNRKSNRIRHRVWEIQSQCYHDDVAIWTPEIVSRVIERLEARKLPDGTNSLIRWAWCMHDKDTIREENVEQLRLIDPLHVYNIGDPRPAHIHLVVEFENSIENTSLSKITNLPINYIREPEASKFQFEAIATYLSHCREEEQKKGKHFYPPEEIHCGNFNYIEEVTAYLAQRRRSLQKSNPRQAANDYINRIEAGKLKFEDAKREITESPEGFAFFLRYEKELRAARTEYIKRRYEMQPRINFYIFGNPGSGKSTMSEYIARALYPDLEESECFYTVGEKGVRLDSYEYQPVLLFEDIRGDKFCDEYGSEGVLNLLEPNPKKRSYNIKYGNVILTHQVNIFTTTDPFKMFVEGLMKEEKSDKEMSHEERVEQAKRRFAVRINIKRNEIDIFTNLRSFEKGYRGPSKFKRYARIENVNIPQLLEERGGKSLELDIEEITAPIVKLRNEYMERMTTVFKYTGEEYRSSKIGVVEGYEEVEKSIREEKGKYLHCCKTFLYAHRLDDGSFGPYPARKGWSLPKLPEEVEAVDGIEVADEVDEADEVNKAEEGVEIEGVYCPFTIEEWKDMGKSVPDEDIADDGMYAEDIQDFVDLDNMKERDRLLSIRERFGETSEAEQDDEPSLSEGISEEDLENSQYMWTDEETAAALENIDMNEERSEIPEWFEEYEARTNALAQQFLSTKAEEDFCAWCHSLFLGHLYDEIKYYTVAWNCLTENWNTVKNACIEAGIFHDGKEWYRFYQKQNYNIANVP